MKELLKTTKQSFDLSVKAQYKKNKDKHSISIPLDVFDEFIVSFNRRFEKVRDNALNVFAQSHNEAGLTFDEYGVKKSLSNQPKIFQIFGYTISVINVGVPPFMVEMPIFGHAIQKEISIPNAILPDFVPSYTLVLPYLPLSILSSPLHAGYSSAKLGNPQCPETL